MSILPHTTGRGQPPRRDSRPTTPRPPGPLGQARQRVATPALDGARRAVVADCLCTSWVPLWVLVSEAQAVGDMSRRQAELALDGLVRLGHAELRTDRDGIHVRAVPRPADDCVEVPVP